MERSFPVHYQNNENLHFSGSSALDRCYVGGKGFSRFLKHQVHPDIWSDSVTEPSYLRSSYCATTTQGAPYSSSDLIGSYNESSSPTNNRLSSNDDLRQNGGSYSDRLDRRAAAASNRARKDSGEGGRPSSKKQAKNGGTASSSGKTASIERDKDSRDRNKEGEGGRDRNKEGEGGRDRNKEEEGVGGSATLLPPANAKNQHTNYSSFRPMNARNNFLGGQQINPIPTSQRPQQSSNTSSSNSRESDDLVAMGTNPLTGRLRPRESSFIHSNGVYMTQSSANTVATSRKFPKTNGFTPTRTRESEPKYADPLSGAPPSFQQRLSEITSLEQETIRYERTKKFKKKKET